LEVSVRTVYRDVLALSTAGVPVYTEQGRGGGIRLLPGYRTDVSGLTADETRALVALTGLALPEDLGLGTALASAVRKIVAAAPASHREAAQGVHQRVLVDHQGWFRTAPAAPFLDVVQQAVWADRQIKVAYRHAGANAAPSQVLHPLGLVVKAGMWYLIAARRGRRRLYRVDRIEAAEVLDIPADRPPDLDLEALWTRMRADVERPRETVRIVLRARQDAVETILLVLSRLHIEGSEAPPTRDARPDLPDADGWVRLELRFRGLDAAHGILAGFGASIEVLQPPQLRQSLASAAADVLALYTEPHSSPTMRVKHPAHQGGPSA
jgi:predicted DNA-binding transcriptional regulator YafY